MIYPMGYKQGRIRAFLRDLAVAFLLLVACYILGIVAWAAQARAATYQLEQATITVEVNNAVEATADGCVIEYAEGPQEVDCETLEPAGGEVKE